MPFFKQLARPVPKMTLSFAAVQRIDRLKASPFLDALLDDISKNKHPVASKYDTFFSSTPKRMAKIAFQDLNAKEVLITGTINNFAMENMSNCNGLWTAYFMADTRVVNTFQLRVDNVWVTSSLFPSLIDASLNKVNYLDQRHYIEWSDFAQYSTPAEPENHELHLFSRSKRSELVNVTEIELSNPGADSTSVEFSEVTEACSTINLAKPEQEFIPSALLPSNDKDVSFSFTLARCK